MLYTTKGNCGINLVRVAKLKRHQSELLERNTDRSCALDVGAQDSETVEAESQLWVMLNS